MVKFGHFVNFQTYFRAKMSCILKLTELLRLWLTRANFVYKAAITRKIKHAVKLAIKLKT